MPREEKKSEDFFERLKKLNEEKSEFQYQKDICKNLSTFVENLRNFMKGEIKIII